MSYSRCYCVVLVYRGGGRRRATFLSAVAISLEGLASGKSSRAYKGGPAYTYGTSVVAPDAFPALWTLPRCLPGPRCPPDARHRCFPDASRMLFRCFPNSSQMLPHLRCPPDASYGCFPSSHETCPRCLRRAFGTKISFCSLALENGSGNHCKMLLESGSILTVFRKLYTIHVRAECSFACHLV